MDKDVVPGKAAHVIPEDANTAPANEEGVPQGELSEWVNAHEALKAVADLYAGDRLRAMQFIIDRAALGVIPSRCDILLIRCKMPSLYTFSYSREGRTALGYADDRGNGDYENCPVPVVFWDQLYNNRLSSEEDWVTGDFKITLDIGTRGFEKSVVYLYKAVNILGVQFKYDALIALLSKMTDSGKVKEYLKTVIAAPEPPASTSMSYKEVVQWCRDWIAHRKDRNSDIAWSVFKTLPQAEGCSRDDVFRPAWKEAKAKQ